MRADMNAVILLGETAAKNSEAVPEATRGHSRREPFSEVWRVVGQLGVA